MVSPATTNRTPNNPDLEKHSGAVLSWKPGHGGDAKELLSAEKDKTFNYEIPDIAFKTVMEDGDQSLDFAQAFYHCIEFEMWSMLKEIAFLMGVKTSEKGLSRHQFLEALTGVIIEPSAARRGMFNSNNERDKGMYNKPPTS